MIELSVRKLVQKVEIHGRRTKSPGYDIHTYYLGLPRSQAPPIFGQWYDERMAEKRRDELRKKLADELMKITNDKNIIDKLIKKIERKRGQLKFSLTIPTGYFYLRGPDIRRKSPLRFSIHPGFVIVYRFETKDFDKIRGDLIHISFHARAQRFVVRRVSDSARVYSDVQNLIRKFCEGTLKIDPNY